MCIVAACVHLAGRSTARQAVGSTGIVGGLVDGERVHVGTQGDDRATARCMGGGSRQLPVDPKATISLPMLTLSLPLPQALLHLQ